MNVKKIFSVSAAIPGVGSRIFIPGMTDSERIDLIVSGNDFEIGWVERTLSNLSMWGGCSSNNPEQYWMYEFTPSRFADAVSFLLAHGYDEVSNVEQFSQAA